MGGNNKKSKGKVEISTAQYTVHVVSRDVTAPSVTSPGITEDLVGFQQTINLLCVRGVS